MKKVPDSIIKYVKSNQCIDNPRAERGVSEGGVPGKTVGGVGDKSAALLRHHSL
ncbi:MAG: hypothetical protein KJZ70_18750 [Bryobacterales bacterium]|nr:hypothetical protein [Bryobacterales bacterium]